MTDVGKDVEGGGSVSNEELIARLRDLAVTTVDDCLGHPPGSNPDQWCIYDRSEDDPPLAEGVLGDLELVIHWAHAAADALAAADAREKKLREALEEVQFMDCCGETREYVDEILEGLDG